MSIWFKRQDMWRPICTYVNWVRHILTWILKESESRRRFAIWTLGFFVGYRILKRGYTEKSYTRNSSEQIVKGFTFNGWGNKHSAIGYWVVQICKLWSWQSKYFLFHPLALHFIIFVPSGFHVDIPRDITCDLWVFTWEVIL